MFEGFLTLFLQGATWRVEWRGREFPTPFQGRDGRGTLQRSIPLWLLSV